MKRHSGHVWWHNKKVGTLREDDRGLLRFAYLSDWLNDNGFPVSVSLPISQGNAETDAHSYFTGLLPEGEARKRICRQWQIDINNDAGLLFAIGADCAGALSILPDQREPGPREAPGQLLTQTDLERIITSHGALIEPGQTLEQRFSLAGAQDKFTLISDARGYRMPQATDPSTHLMKFETVRHVCFAEYMATQIAGELGLPTINMTYNTLNQGKASVPWLKLDRYDRAQHRGQTVRLHQEDLIQALGYPTAYKYEHDGGPDLQAVATLLREVVETPLEAIANLRDWQIFNLLIGNWDGHGKNLALLYPLGSDVPVLAPFYDLVSIEHINKVGKANYARDLAFSIGGDFTPERITRASWAAFARQLGIPLRPLIDRVADLATRIPESATVCLSRYQTQQGCHPMHRTFMTMVKKRARWVYDNLSS